MFRGRIRSRMAESYVTVRTGTYITMLSVGVGVGVGSGVGLGVGL